ncbi:MAG TPA: hypothetical protein VFL91_27925 [Thermomicrobiales bacterium]|nr:hypothetical protein [Thermomicrobiales bacterium]
MRLPRFNRFAGRIAALVAALSMVLSLVGYFGAQPTVAATPSPPGYTPDATVQGSQSPDNPVLLTDNAGNMHAVWSDAAFAGMIFHAMFRVGSGSPASLSNWGVERIDGGAGKNPSAAIDPATGNLWAVWQDDSPTVWGRRWTPGGWGPIVNLIANAGGTCANPCFPAVAWTPDHKVHVVHVDSGLNVVYDQFDENWNYQTGSTKVVSSSQANHWAQIAGDSTGTIHIAWSQATFNDGTWGGGNAKWDIFYAKRNAAGVWDNNGSIEQVSHNVNGSVDRWPTIMLDANNNPIIAWQGDDAGPCCGIPSYRIYQRARGADSNPWPAYSDPSPFRVDNVGDSENPRYGFSLSHRNLLAFVEESGNRIWNLRTLNQAGGVTTIDTNNDKWAYIAESPVDHHLYAIYSTFVGDGTTLNLAQGSWDGTSWTSVGQFSESGSPPPPSVTEPPAPWTPWASQGGILSDSPAAASLGSRAYVFVKGSDNALYTKSTDAAGNFSNWQNLGGILTAAPAAASFNGRLYAFAKGSDNALYVKSSADGVNWSDWADQGGILLAPPAAASANGKLFAFAMGSDKALYVKWTADGTNWSNWASLGGILTAAPAAAGFNGQIYAFAKGSDNALYVKSSTDGVNWGNWSDLGGILVAAPAAAVSGDGGTLYTFAAGNFGFAFERHMAAGGAWSDWVSLGGKIVGPPAAASIPGGPLFVFVRWTDNALWDIHNP